MTSDKKEPPKRQTKPSNEPQSKTSTSDLSRASESFKGMTLPTVGSHLTNPFASQSQPQEMGSQATSTDSATPPQANKPTTQSSDSPPKATDSK